MMRVKLAYGNEGTAINVPEGVQTERFGLNMVDKPVSLSGFVKSFTTAGVGRFLDVERPLIVVNDAYRSTPTSRLLGWLNHCDHNLLNRARFLIATGAHEAPTEGQLTDIFGSFLDGLSSRVFWHDATDLESMVRIGRDRFGAEVYLNRMVLESQRLLVIGSVEPHYFAGFTGGRKALFPGLTDLATIERNHNLASSLQAAPLKMVGNPVAEHLDELLGLIDLDKVLALQVVTDAGGRIDKMCFGSLDQAFQEAIEAATGLYANFTSDKFDMALAELRPPLDRNLYQAQKALENCQTAVVDGGAVVVVSACNEGIGSGFFLAQAANWDRDANRPVGGVVRFGSHKLSRVNAIGRRINVGLFSNLAASVVQQVFFRPVEDLQKYMSDFFAARKNKRLAIIHDAGHSVLQPTHA
jgi:nickel-dependent lactate racemase